jgi:DNA phosphorothioation system restriction enzyme
MNTSGDDLAQDFFMPALRRAVRYDRAVGYFSSGWLKDNARGMLGFAANGGRGRWVTSPILAEEDWEALQSGDAARRDPTLHKALEQNIADLSELLEKDTLSALAWMVADEILDFRLALPRNKLERGNFHDKFGVFTDAEGNQVSFNGSYNDSVQGSRNYESIKIFCSWEPHFALLVRSDVNRFEQLWNNMDPNVRVFDMPEAAREQILQLRTDSRPYPRPEWITEDRSLETRGIYSVVRPAIPGHVVLRDYQVEAIQAWFDNDCQGLLEMATGTGKTITALAASVRLYESERQLALIIACPYRHLVDQWYEEARSFGYAPLRAYESRNTWLDELNERIMSYNYGDTDRLCVITTHTTFSTEHFQKTIERIEDPALLIADEAHHLGAEAGRQHLPEKVDCRLALSATPDRWYDDQGTAALREYFGDTVYTLSLGDAIGVSLTPYYYYPILVELTEEELEEYRLLSAKIGRLMAQIGDKEDEQLTQLMVKRARLLNSAENKLEVISEQLDKQSDLSHTLFYCAPGQIDDVVRILGWDKKLQVHRFTAKEDLQTRRELLESFADGELQALAAMHCLDEGVDVPSTRTAYILASSSNPRQFIQRRGRVLRKFPGKHFATVYDLIAVPPPRELGEVELKAERSILRRELGRFAEFADSALNTQSAYEVIWDLADQYGVLDFQ